MDKAGETEISYDPLQINYCTGYRRNDEDLNYHSDCNGGRRGRFEKLQLKLAKAGDYKY